jgi:alpha-1,6-mannosyltransferase
MNSTLKLSPIWFYVAALVSVLWYYSFAYYLERANFVLLFVFYSGIFIGFLVLISSESNYKFLLGILFRLILLFQIPNLSQDFYRFIWDGRLIISGLNPYSFLPVDIVKSVLDGDFLITKMGDLSAHNHSNYPPLNQLIFAIGAFISSGKILGNVLIFRVIIISADIGVYVFGGGILEFLGQPKSKIHLYFLNPLIIIELTGNLHFEGLMIFFMCLGYYLFYKSKYFGSAVFIAFAILIKLLPLMLLPFFMKRMKMSKLLIFYAVTGFICLAAFVPFFDENLLTNYSKTVGLWFTNFEFNASVYYVLREIGFWITGYNIIGILGKISPVVMVSVIFYLAIRKNGFLQTQYLALMVYFLLSTTIHPWYLSTIIFLGVFLNTKSIWIWSYTIIFSYSAYSGNQFSEKPFFLFMEYLPVVVVLYFEAQKMLKETTISV